MEKKYSPEQVQELIDQYFDHRKPCKLKDEDGDTIPISANVLMYDFRPPTLTGLKRETIGRNCWEDYKKDPRYVQILEDAESRVEEWHEARLSSSGCTGSIFYLKNYGHGWRDETDTAVKVSMSLDKGDEELYKKNLEVFFGSRSETA